MTAQVIPPIIAGSGGVITEQLDQLPTSGAAFVGVEPTANPRIGKNVLLQVNKELVGLGNVDNTSDANKPISTATQAALASKADLVAGKVPASQLPSYVDDVEEYATLAGFPATGETGKIYVDLSTGRIYRWSGSTYAEISASLALGETSSTAYRGDRGKTAFDHSQITSGNPHGVTAAMLSDFSSAARTASGPIVFTAASRSTTAPGYVGQVGFESDTDRVYRATGTSAGNWQVMQSSVVYDFTMSSRPAIATGSAGTYQIVIPDWVTSIRWECSGGGSGGGSGRSGAAASARFGGGGGASGSWCFGTIDVSQLASRTLDVTVGAGGAGGAAVSNSNGNPGTSGGVSSFSCAGSAIGSSQAGVSSGGGGGTNAVGAAGAAQGTAMYAGVGGGASSATAAASAGLPSQYTSSGGGGGGGISTGDVAFQGGDSGSAAGRLEPRSGASRGAIGANGSNGGATPAGRFGTGGGGGGASLTGAGGNGGNGGPGAGGGGGGASVSPALSGAGGNGGSGLVRLVCFG